MDGIFDFDFQLIKVTGSPTEALGDDGGFLGFWLWPASPSQFAEHWFLTGACARDGKLSFDKQGRASKRPDNGARL